MTLVLLLVASENVLYCDKSNLERSQSREIGQDRGTHPWSSVIVNQIMVAYIKLKKGQLQLDRLELECRSFLVSSKLFARILHKFSVINGLQLHNISFAFATVWV